MKYDQSAVIEKATQLFWQKGFMASGMRDIQQALDMRPGSIYARFKSKSVLFKLVIEQYIEVSKTKLMRVANAEFPIKALRQFILELLIVPEESRYKRQCLLVRTMPESYPFPA